MIRHLNHYNGSIIYILFIYYVEAAHLTATTVSWAIIYSDIKGPMPFYLAQLAATLFWCTANSMFLLGSSVSVMKVLYVTHFDVIFNQDQEFIGKMALGLILLAACCPPIVFCFYQSAQGTKLIPSVAYLMGENMKAEKLASPTMIYGFLLLLVNIFMLLFAIVFIRHYEKRLAPVVPGVVERNVGKSVSLVKVFMGIAGLLSIVIQTIVSKFYVPCEEFPIQLLLEVLVIFGMLLAFVIDENVLKFCRHKFSAGLADVKMNLRIALGGQHNRVDPS